MTFPFENNTKAVVKRLADRSMRADRRRNLFAVATIALAVCLMSTFAFYYAADNEKTLRKMKAQYQAGCVNMDPGKIERLAGEGKFEQYGYETGADTVSYRDSNLMVTFVDPGMLKLDQWEAITGAYPEKAGEIAVERAFLDYYGLDLKPGGTLKIDVGQGEREYTVSGILEKEKGGRMFYVFISQAAVEAGGDPAPYSLKFRFAGGSTQEPDRLRADIAAFFEEVGIPKEDTFYSSTYFDLSDLYLGSDLSVYVVALFVAAACSFVIYNIFYISVMGKMKEYGRLKVIGATPSQLKAVVRRERRILSVTAIPMGLAAGALLSCLIMPGYWVWGENLKYMAIIAALTAVVILLSTGKPVKLAGRVSAIEAVRASAYSGAKGKNVSRRLHRRLDAFHLAVMNLSRSRKKAAVTLLSLGFTGILVVCISAYGNSIDIREMARAQMGDGGDYLLSLENLYGEDLRNFQRENTLDESLLSRLSKLKGVKRLTAYSAAPFFVPQIMEDENFIFSGLTREQMGTMLSGEAVRDGEADYDALVSGDGILAIRYPDNLLKKLYGVKEYAVGDKIELQTLDGRSRIFTVQGVVKPIGTGDGANFFILPEDVLHEMYPDIDNFTASINIHAGEDSQELRESVFKAVTDPSVMITSLDDLAGSMGPAFRSILKGIYGLVIFIFGFSLMNLVNTLITNLLSRQQEIGILQSVGMSGRQLSQMLSWECMLYLLGTLLVTLTLGTVLSVIVCGVFSQIGTFGRLTYHFPFLAVVLFTAALMAIQAVFSVAAARYVRRQSLVERIKTMD